MKKLNIPILLLFILIIIATFLVMYKVWDDKAPVVVNTSVNRIYLDYEKYCRGIKGLPTITELSFNKDYSDSVKIIACEKDTNLNVI